MFVCMSEVRVFLRKEYFFICGSKNNPKLTAHKIHW